MRGDFIESARGKKALLGFGLIIAAQVGFVIVRAVWPSGAQVASSMPDVNPEGYSLEKLREVLGYFRQHPGATLTVYAIDILLPFACLTFFANLGGWLLAKLGKRGSPWSLAAWLPRLTCLSDYVENATVLLLALAWPGETTGGAERWLASVTTVKFAGYLGNLAGLFFLGAWLLARRTGQRLSSR